jgi:hypothetical protein
MFERIFVSRPWFGDNGYGVAGVDSGVFGWRGQLLMRKEMATLLPPPPPPK